MLNQRKPILGLVFVLSWSIGACSPFFAFEQCQSDSDCPSLHLCSTEKLCRNIKTEQCHSIEGPLDNEQAIRIGASLHLSGVGTESGVPVLSAIQLAVREINATGGVGGHQSGRPLLLIACDDETNPEQAALIAKHLDEVLSVPVILGSNYSSVTLGLAREALKRKIAVISPSSTAIEISDLDDQGLIWRTAPPDSFQGEALAYFAAWQALKQEAMRPGSKIRVLIVSVDDAYGRSLGGDIQKRLETHLSTGQGAIDLDLLRLSYVSGDSASISSAATALGASSPDIIIFIGLDDGVSLIRQAVQDPNLLSVPWFLSDGVRSESLRTLFSSSNPKPEFFFGGTYASRTGVVFDRFAEAYREAYKKQDGPEVWTEHAYDATYLAAYALSGIEDEISGTAFAKSMTQLSGDGALNLNVGPSDFIAVTEAIRRGESVTIEGASGALVFSEHGDRAIADILRWDIDESKRTYLDCGEAVSLSSSRISLSDEQWCQARCMMVDSSTTVLTACRSEHVPRVVLG